MLCLFKKKLFSFKSNTFSFFRFIFFFHKVELELFLVWNIEVLQYFKSCWNTSDARKYIVSTITDLYFFGLIEMFGRLLLLAPKPVYWSPKSPGHRPGGVKKGPWRNHIMKKRSLYNINFLDRVSTDAGKARIARKE